MKFIAHDKPVLRGESNYIARISLSPFGLSEVFEQVWLGEVRDGEGELCCIPFRAYGISLRDRVRLSADGANVVEVVERSGRRVLRVFLDVQLGPEASRGQEAEITLRVKAAGLLSEWCGARHVAVDVAGGEEPVSLLAYLEEGERRGRLRWEWGDALSFAV
ncbi:DUF4265 domain-containing protein [Kribbella sp. NPDC051620]|uniref:DUF4265 domain-containing protein n=1 Tax=Kribbella sp. NPDC051620 TaxID=3364120 RepID=UPI00379B27B8